jgi:two-component system OmpR family sensor kinase
MGTDDERRVPGTRLPVLSVRVKILAAMLAITALGLAASGGTAYLLQRDRIVGAVDDVLLLRVEAVRAVIDGSVPAAAAPADPVPGDAADPLAPVVDPAVVGFASVDSAMQEVLERVLPGSFESTVGIVDGQPRWVPGVAQDFDLAADEAFIDRVVAETDDGSAVLGTADSEEGGLRYVAVPVTLEGLDGRGVYVTAVRLESELADLRSVISIYAGVAAVALLAVALVGWFVAGRLLRPIRRLQSTAARITATGLHERIPVAGRDDVSDLTRTVNGMVERLEKSFHGQQRLLDDVRHELNTPLTIVRGHLELLDAGDPADVEATRALAIDELDRMGILVEDIATLAQAERGEGITRTATDVDELSRAVAAKVRGIAGHDWVLAETAPVVVQLDAHRITQAWLQLAENAAKYSPEGTEILLGSSVTPAGLELWVVDSGPGIPDDARERVFERFGRVDAGRGIRGSGLGLAIVAAIAEAHGGRVGLDSVVGRGSRFAIVIPDDDDDHPRRDTE